MTTPRTEWYIGEHDQHILVQRILPLIECEQAGFWTALILIHEYMRTYLANLETKSFMFLCTVNGHDARAGK